MSNTDGTSTTAIVFSCDEAYVFLARGLVLSLVAAGYPNSEAKLILIDIGCSPRSLQWMKEHGVEVVEIGPNLIPEEISSVIKPHQRAQVVRPWLPELLPQIEHFIWLDCDLWVQNAMLLKVMRAGARIRSDSILIAPSVSHYNATFYVDINNFIKMQRTWFESYYPADIVEKLSTTISFSSGVFGLNRSSPVWDLWKQEEKFLYPIVAAREPRLVHLAEQTALNVVIHRSTLVTRLDPLYNFHCNSGGAMRLPGGRVVASIMVPPQDIGVVHLASWSNLRDHYLEWKLLYQGGEYLWPDEWAAIMSR